MLLIALVGGPVLAQASFDLNAQCAPHDEADASTVQCQSWCRFAEHCSLCKCRGCSLCQSCTSSVEGDSQFATCEDWCSVHAHCDHCKCQGCSFCKACTPRDEHDYAFEGCEEWCSDEHCDTTCKCKARARVERRGTLLCFRAARARPHVSAHYCARPADRCLAGPECISRYEYNPQACPFCSNKCTPKDESDYDYTSCEPWCHSPAYHCPFCKCKGCELCTSSCMGWCASATDCAAEACAGCELCQKQFAAGEAAGRAGRKCEAWCSPAACRKDSCMGCAVCAQLHPEMRPAKPCASGLRDDIAHEECSKWCAESHREAHCAHCACRACAFCVPKSALHESGVDCPPASDDDSRTMRCEPFCDDAQAASHCELCKCKNCVYCPRRFDSGIECDLRTAAGGGSDAPDAPTRRCEPFCSAAFAGSHCALCKCAACDFCGAVAAADVRPASSADAARADALTAAPLPNQSPAQHWPPPPPSKKAWKKSASHGTPAASSSSPPPPLAGTPSVALVTTSPSAMSDHVLLGERLSDHVKLLDPQLPAQQVESTAVAAVASSLAPAPASLAAPVEPEPATKEERRPGEYDAVAVSVGFGMLCWGFILFWRQSARFTRTHRAAGAGMKRIALSEADADADADSDADGHHEPDPIGYAPGEGPPPPGSRPPCRGQELATTLD